MRYARRLRAESPAIDPSICPHAKLGAGIEQGRTPALYRAPRCAGGDHPDPAQRRGHGEYHAVRLRAEGRDRDPQRRPGPEIMDLARFLRAMGARIQRGSSTVRIEGGRGTLPRL